MRWCGTILFWLAATAATLASPQEALAAAAADARTLDPKVAAYTRYLDLTHFPPAERAEWRKVLSFHLNSLSRETLVVPVRPVAGGAVVAVNLLDYAIDPKVYDRLADADPYFTVRFDVKEEGHPRQRQGDKELIWNGVDWVWSADGKLWYKAVPMPPAPTAKPSGVVRKNAAALWLDPKLAAELIERTQSIAPLLRGDWFFFETAIQADRVAGYYDFLGLGKNLADFQKLIGANEKEANRLKLVTAAAVGKSSVTLNNRAITRSAALTGGYWITADFKTSTDRQNTLRLLKGDTQPPDGDASEQYGVLPDGLFAYWLNNNQVVGGRQDTAPDFIASDGSAPGTDRRVHSYVSCARCHVEGLRPIDDYARRLYQRAVELRSPSYEKLVELRRLYLTDLGDKLATDRLVFAKAVRACNGLTPAENARAVGAAWEWYAERAVTPAQAAIELGCAEADLMAKLKVYAAKDAIIDPVLASYLQVPPLALRREHLEEIFPLLQKVVGNIP